MAPVLCTLRRGTSKCWLLYCMAAQITHTQKCGPKWHFQPDRKIEKSAHGPRRFLSFPSAYSSTIATRTRAGQSLYHNNLQLGASRERPCCDRPSLATCAASSAAQTPSSSPAKRVSARSPSAMKPVQRCSMGASKSHISSFSLSLYCFIAFSLASLESSEVEQGRIGEARHFFLPGGTG